MSELFVSITGITLYFNLPLNLQGILSQQFMTWLIPRRWRQSKLLAANWPLRNSQPSFTSEASSKAFRVAKDGGPLGTALGTAADASDASATAASASYRTDAILEKKWPKRGRWPPLK